jgi:hypothetical protein
MIADVFMNALSRQKIQDCKKGHRNGLPLELVVDIVITLREGVIATSFNQVCLYCCTVF